jgi:gas vesicle protein
MENENGILKKLVAGGIIGAALGALIAEDEGEGATIGAIAGAVLFATLKANEEAKQTNVPFYIQEDFKLYKIASDGTKHFIKEIEKPSIQLNKNFKLH